MTTSISDWLVTHLTMKQEVIRLSDHLSICGSKFV